MPGASRWSSDFSDPYKDIRASPARVFFCGGISTLLFSSCCNVFGEERGLSWPPGKRGFSGQTPLVSLVWEGSPRSTGTKILSEPGCLLWLCPSCHLCLPILVSHCRKKESQACRLSWQGYLWHNLLPIGDKQYFLAGSLLWVSFLFQCPVAAQISLSRKVQPQSSWTTPLVKESHMLLLAAT